MRPTASARRAPLYLVLVLGSVLAATALSSCVQAPAYAAPLYRIGYEANGADSGLPPIDGASYAAGESFTLLPNSGNMVKAGFTFVGWGYYAEYPAELAEPVGRSFEVEHSDLAFCAMWSDKPCHRAYFDWGLGDGPILDPNFYPEGGRVRLGLALASRSKEGYEFAGWTAYPNPGPSYPNGGAVAMGSADLSFRAIWMPAALHGVWGWNYDGPKLWIWEQPDGVPSSLLLPEGIDSIGICIFYGQRGLEKVDLPSTLTEIDSGAFARCPGLALVTVRAPTPPTYHDLDPPQLFVGCAPDLRILVPAGSVDAYKLAFGWSSYADKIAALASP
jgi:hypothetical protein